MVSAAACGTFMESERVCAPRKIDEDLIVGAFGGVVFRKLAAKAACLYANCGIQMRVEIARAPKNFRRNLIFLGCRPRVVPGMIGQVPQQFAQRLGTMQSMAAKEFFNLSPVMSLVRHSSHPGTSL